LAILELKHAALSSFSGNKPGPKKKSGNTCSKFSKRLEEKGENKGLRWQEVKTALSWHWSKTADLIGQRSS